MANRPAFVVLVAVSVGACGGSEFELARETAGGSGGAAGATNVGGAGGTSGTGAVGGSSPGGGGTAASSGAGGSATGGAAGSATGGSGTGGNPGGGGGSGGTSATGGTGSGGALPSCGALYAGVTGTLQICDESDQCVLAADTDPNDGDPGQPCAALCAAGGGECLAAYDNGVGACVVDTLDVRVCSDATMSEGICICSRGCGGGPPCAAGKQCVSGSCS